MSKNCSHTLSNNIKNIYYSPQLNGNRGDDTCETSVSTRIFSLKRMVSLVLLSSRSPDITRIHHVRGSWRIRWLTPQRKRAHHKRTQRNLNQQRAKQDLVQHQHPKSKHFYKSFSLRGKPGQPGQPPWVGISDIILWESIRTFISSPAFEHHYDPWDRIRQICSNFVAACELYGSTNLTMRHAIL